ncbi:RagB/SusD family nutrient uptake outer membrane protein [Chitinophaga barathri]|uniref:RagB/SusD family nutrient uptake outer membrane protein n=1 Tax=Chitinophaga barathri TaxID=1647451 RepID=A0A3N4N092_9BACT|nr:RagB/SusD family nutrient uptake outer membrane protein [Chitinophaga barathri]RPD41043.1 RagB/SusD family nutrient uptake outer membrane protein [Chitinophaga barathri]
MKKYFLYITAITFAASACNKQLDLRPSDYIDPEGAYQNVEDVNQGLLGAYSILSYYSSIRYTSLITDENMLPSENSTGSGFATHRWQYDGSFLHDAWKDNYIAIDRLNRALSASRKVAVLPSQHEALAQYQGELLALRAYCHLELVRNFAEKYEPAAMGVPYMDSSYIGKPARLSFGQTMAKINEDLAAAKGLIPGGFDDRTRITKAAVSALQARVALYEKNWDNAITFATEAITALPLATRTQFPQIWKDNSTAEVFWKLKRVTGDEEIGGFYTQAGFLDNPAGRRVYYAASYKLTNLFDKVNDIRFSSYITIDPGRLAAGNVPNVVVKYIGANASASNLVDVKLLRTGEMYLIRAEAYAEKTQPGLAADDLNNLRAARIAGYVPQTFADKAAIIAAVYTERFKELAFEGHRHFDLRRRDMNISRNPQDAVNALGAVLLTPNDAEYVFPIPNSELRANPNMKQNPGYVNK